jgi:hypothetical protein
MNGRFSDLCTGFAVAVDNRRRAISVPVLTGSHRPGVTACARVWRPVDQLLAAQIRAKRFGRYQPATQPLRIPPARKMPAQHPGQD